MSANLRIGSSECMARMTWKRQERKERQEQGPFVTSVSLLGVLGV